MPQGFEFIADRMDRDIFAQTWRIIEREARLSGLQVLLLVTPAANPDVLGYQAETCRLVVDPSRGAKETIRQLLLGLGFHLYREAEDTPCSDSLARNLADSMLAQMTVRAQRSTRCSARRKDGHPCCAVPRVGERYCVTHQAYRLWPDADFNLLDDKGRITR